MTTGDSGLPVLFATNGDSVEIRFDLEHETVWATQAQIAQVFGVDRSVISKHITNVFAGGELEETRHVQKCTCLRRRQPMSTHST